MTINRRHLIAGAAATTVAAGSSAAMSPNATPATADALRNYRAAHAHFCDRAAFHEDEEAAFAVVIEAEKALLTSPTVTPEDIALKLEYALAEGLCGDEMGAELEKLDHAMFRGMIDALRAMQAEG